MYRSSDVTRRSPAFRPFRFLPAIVAGLALVTAACNDASTTASMPSAVTQPSFTASQSAGSPGFTVLANAAVTCTDGAITGDVGTFLAPPTGSITQTSCPVTGTVQVGTQAAGAAFSAFVATYAQMTPQAGDACTQLTGTLAGVVLAPGVYCFDAAAALTGVLTLQGPANGTWVFKVGTSGTGALTGTNFAVVMAGGAQACNVTWWVAQAVTMTTSAFQGNILAGAAITFTGGTFNGNAWSKADVTMTGTTVVGCAGVNGTGPGTEKQKCNQGVGNGAEGCDPGNSNNHNPSNDENGGVPGNPGRKGSK